MISIVIPLYNKDKSIVRTLESVKAQTFTDYECIIVNDGSTDHSAQVVEDWISCHLAVSPSSPFRLISQPNGGVSSARNRGIEEAQGEYVVFLDGDDLWDAHILDEMVKLTEDFPNATIYGVGSAYEEHGIKGSCPIHLPEGFRGVVDNVWAYGRMMCYTSSSVCIPRDQIELFDEKLTHGEDLDVWFRMMLKGDVVFYNKTLAYYVQDSENRAMCIMPDINKHLVSVIDRYADARANNKEFCIAFDTQMIYFLYPYLFTNQKEIAIKLAHKLNYRLLKSSLRFRMEYPYLYKIYLKWRGRE